MGLKKTILYYPEGTTGAKEIFSSFEKLEVRSYPNDRIKEISKEEPTILIANTRFQVNRDNIQQFPTVKIFATVSSGTDHVDFNILKEFGKFFLNAPGCNAGSVAEYCFAGLLSRFEESELKRLKVGLIGHGHTGKEFYKILISKGVNCIFYDPFYKTESSPLNEVLDASVLSFHVPLTKDGPEPTFQFVSASLIDSLKPGTVFINTSRGGILSQEAFDRLIARNDIFKILDVFDPEPPASEMGRKLAEMKHSILTPHIAGYSQLGRIVGTYRVAEKLSILYRDKPLPSLKSFLQTSGEFKTSTFLKEEDRLLREAWRNGDTNYFEKRRNTYPIRLDWGF
ncbi:4-phosphoerythronate dehydrogenase [Leptospira kirschneri serovar Bim str. 1051]|uniref:NAD(P)-dependent oxidoreductase n=1 Tax=Leptospira kirschneri TaxID=29507 RepID=UPI0002BD9D41|nr:NAD(P)-dependent oxidoreductase [Leptospira kirschneri]EMK14773.1 4-phosphoerythronate dehydrogenase [Leptospira kirschneri serovar Bim str. PUO 1247]EMN03434.1 4-phosphoerythronate dehydrogenase [Leptospira kirschneri serovar Bim str. 1051]